MISKLIRKLQGRIIHNLSGDLSRTVSADPHATIQKIGLIFVETNGFDLKKYQNRALVLVANHPFGVIDGCLLSRLGHELRPKKFQDLSCPVHDEIERV